MNLTETSLVAVFAVVFFVLLYRSLPQAGQGRNRLAKCLIALNGILLLLSLNLYFAAKNEILVKDTIEKYSVSSTVELLTLLHDPSHAVHMEENRIYIDKGSDSERVFVFMRTPFFHIMDQGKLVQLAKDLPK